MFAKVFFTLAFVFVISLLACIYVKYYAGDEIKSKLMDNCNIFFGMCADLIDSQYDRSR